MLIPDIRPNRSHGYTSNGSVTLMKTSFESIRIGFRITMTGFRVVITGFEGAITGFSFNTEGRRMSSSLVVVVAFVRDAETGFICLGNLI